MGLSIQEAALREELRTLIGKWDVPAILYNLAEAMEPSCEAEKNARQAIIKIAEHMETVS